VQRAPDTRYLTEYALWLGLAGLAASAFSQWVALFVFPRPLLEYAILLLMAFLVRFPPVLNPLNPQRG